MTSRLLRVRSLLKREIGNVIERDFHFENVLVTINDVDLTPDLRNGHVYVGTVGGNPHEQRTAIEKLEQGRSLIQRRIASRVVLKNTPRLQFHIDDSVARGVDLVNLMQEIDALPTAREEDAAQEEE